MKKTLPLLLVLAGCGGFSGTLSGRYQFAGLECEGNEVVLSGYYENIDFSSASSASVTQTTHGCSHQTDVTFTQNGSAASFVSSPSVCTPTACSLEYTVNSSTVSQGCGSFPSGGAFDLSGDGETVHGSVTVAGVSCRSTYIKVE